MGMCGHGAAVLDGQAGPLRVGDADEGAGGAGARGERDAGLVLAGRGEVLRQAGGKDVPGLAMAVRRSVDLGAEDGGEAVGAKGRVSTIGKP